MHRRRESQYLMIKRFWDLEIVGNNSANNEMTPLEKLEWKKARDSFNGERYEMVVPWREDRPNLPNNRPMAKKPTPVCIKRKLSEDDELAKAYQKLLE